MQPEKKAAGRHERSARQRFLARLAGRLDRRASQLKVRSDQFVRIRFMLILAGGLLVFAAFRWGGGLTGWLSLVFASAAFGVVAFLHGRIKSALKRHQAWLEIKRRHLARMSLNWAGIPQPAEISVPADHPFAADLDLIGPRSLFRLVDASLSEEGSQRLCDWMLNADPGLEAILQRRDLVGELAPLSLFRDKMELQCALSPSQAREKLSGRKLVDWLQRSGDAGAVKRAFLIALALAAFNALLLYLDFGGGYPAYWTLGLLAYVAFFFSRQGEVHAIFGGGLLLENALDQYRRIFEFLEQFHYGEHSRLRNLCEPFLAAESRPSTFLRRLARPVSALSVRAYFPFWILLNLVFPWDFFFARLLQRRKLEGARLLPRWLDVWHELEALNSLAQFSHLNPDYSTPILIPDGCLFEARDLGHPLIPQAERVCNDFAIDSRGRIKLVTGSNMAGKSTFLRTVGINAALAQAGGPVCASAFRSSLFRIFCCIRVTDSVTDGYSYFFAEVRRLKAMLMELEKDHPLPVLFLIDEIFKGTNNRERLIGSRSFVRRLTDCRGCGLISTHDLELTRLADELAAVSNQHFREEIVDGLMRFDYRLRPGPCPTTNALKLMRLEGLPVDSSDSK